MITGNKKINIIVEVIIDIIKLFVPLYLLMQKQYISIKIDIVNTAPTLRKVL